MKQQGSRISRRRAASIWAAGFLTILCIAALARTNIAVLDRLTALAFDGYQQIKPRIATGAPVVVVDIDETSIRELGQWPWPRSDLAAIVDRIGEYGAAAIAFDIVFSEPDRTSLARAVTTLETFGARIDLPSGGVPDNDELLGESFARNRVTAGFVLTEGGNPELGKPKAGFAFAGEDPQAFLLNFSGGVPNLPVLTENAAGLGYFSFPASRDAVVRRIPLVAKGNGQLYPALTVEALRTAQGAGAIVIRGTGASGEADTGRPAMTALKVGDFEVPTGPAGDFWVYYSGLPDIRMIPAAKFLDPAARDEVAPQIEGHIVLVGSSAIGLRDLVATPLAAGVPGVLVHAEIIDQILGQTFLTRPDWAPGAELAAAVVLAVILLLAVHFFGPILGAATAISMAAAALAISWTAFSRGQLLIDPILPTATVLAVYTVATAVVLLITDREKQFVRRAFGQYLSPDMVKRLAEDPNALALGGETREITIHFCDIRGFTTLSEGLDPQDLTRLLNNFLTPMTDVLLASGATIDKYIGDSIMCFWNAPLPLPNHGRAACLATLRMVRELERLNQRENMKLKLGIGLNSGICCVGNLGSEQRFSYSAIGDAVNVASRVEGLTKQYGVSILVTETTAAQAPDLAFLEADLVRVVGRTKPIAVYTLLGDAVHAASAEFQTLRDAHKAFLGAYRAGQFDRADDALANVASHAPAGLANLYDLYVERLATLRADPPPAGWDGVFTARQK